VDTKVAYYPTLKLFDVGSLSVPRVEGLEITYCAWFLASLRQEIVPDLTD